MFCDVTCNDVIYDILDARTRLQGYIRRPSGTFHTILNNMLPISQDKQNNIRSQLLVGLSTRQIATFLGVSNATVSRIRCKTLPDLLTSSGGHPKLLSTRDVSRTISHFTSDEASTAPKIAQVLSDVTKKSVQPSTVRRELKKSGIKAALKGRKALF